MSTHTAIDHLVRYLEQIIAKRARDLATRDFVFLALRIGGEEPLDLGNEHIDRIFKAACIAMEALMVPLEIDDQIVFLGSLYQSIGLATRIVQVTPSPKVCIALEVKPTNGVWVRIEIPTLRLPAGDPTTPERIPQ